jgi:TRAP-type mannitol/chloroaromatic compound transport system permease small subunit
LSVRELLIVHHIEARYASSNNDENRDTRTGGASFGYLPLPGHVSATGIRKMPKIIKRYIEVVDRMNYFVGRATMYMIFVMIGVLFYSSVTKTFFFPALWTLEFAQFLMVSYFLLGGAYSIQLKGHVRMDLLYSRGSERTQHKWDTFTSFFMIAYLLMLLYGSISSLTYAIEYGERSYSSWRPYMWPVKVVMTTGIILMLLQAFSQFFKDLAAARGKSIE